MPADTFLWLLTQALFIGVFLVVGFNALRRPATNSVDIALLFGTIAAIMVLSDLPDFQIIESAAWLTATLYALVVVLPLVMLRLADDFSPQPKPLVLGATAAGLALGISPFLVPEPWPAWFSALPEVWFVALGGYATAAFVIQARMSRGVTARRMFAVAVGSGLIAFVLLLSLLELIFTLPEPATIIGVRLAALSAGVAYLLGFAPPPLIRRAWQVPELHSFLGRAVDLPRLPHRDAIVAALERGAAESTGALGAVIGLWNPDRRTLSYRQRSGTLLETADDEFFGGRAFTLGTPVFTADAGHEDPANAAQYRESGARAVLAAPITAGTRRIGVLTVYAPRAPIFADDDLALVKLLADQAAVVLESRALINDAARVAAREETTRLKDDFLSAAAHDLRTPLTTLLLHAELLQREADAEGGPSPRVERIVSEAKRLRELVSELLDGMAAERPALSLHRQETDLVALAAELAADRASASHSIRLETDGVATADVDPTRIRQLLENLLDNAIKYSPDGGEVVVRIRSDAQEVHLAVVDSGIGIPQADLPHLFDRFHRGSNVDDRRFHGLGLGLYICRGIVEQHGGTIAAASEPGGGARFEVTLPVRAPVTAAGDAGAVDRTPRPDPLPAAPPLAPTGRGGELEPAVDG